MTKSRHNPSLREQLDAVRPGSDGLRHADLQEAAAAVESSGEWRKILDNQQQIDRLLADAMQDVELPEGAQQRLLQSLAAAGEASPFSDPQELSEASCPIPPTVAASDPPQRVSRRRWASIAAATVGLTACIGLGLLLWSGGPATLTLDEIRSQIPLAADGQIDASRLAPFDDAFLLTLPSGRWDRVAIGDPVGIDWSHDGTHDAALLPFTTGGRHPLSGYLLIAPASAVTAPPARTFLSTAGISYFPVDNTAWTSTAGLNGTAGSNGSSGTNNAAGVLVYVCFVDPGKLPALQRLLYPHSA